MYLFHKAYSRNCKDLSSQFPLKNSYSSENSWVLYDCISESSIFSWINFHPQWVATATYERRLCTPFLTMGVFYFDWMLRYACCCFGPIILRDTFYMIENVLENCITPISLLPSNYHTHNNKLWCNFGFFTLIPFKKKFLHFFFY